MDRALRTFETGDRGIGVDGDDQLVASRPRLGQQGNMPGVEQVEAAVGEADTKALPAPAGDPLQGLVQTGSLGLAKPQILGPKREDQFLRMNHGGPGLADDDTGSDRGEPCCVGKIEW